MNLRPRLGICAILVTLSVGLPALAYEFPLSSEAIREAYFLGTRPNRAETDFLAQYSHIIPQLHVGLYKSVITIETPYVQVATHARNTQNYHAQDAVEDFHDKRLVFRVVMDVYFWRKPSDSANIRLIQKDKEVTPQSAERSSLYPMSDEFYTGGSIGEHVEMNFDPETIDSAALTIRIETPTGKVFKTEFDLAELK